MAADILAYDADIVPTGIDQKQHVELARDIALRFNKKYGETFKLPEPFIKSEVTKIMDLQDPTKKMSKSSSNQKGVIRLLDDLNDIRKKIMSAVTDSESKVYYDQTNKPGISNLMNIYSCFSNLSLKEIEEKYENANYGVFKKDLADLVINEISKIQNNYNEIINSKSLDQILDNGKEITNKIAKEKYELMKEKMGLHR